MFARQPRLRDVQISVRSTADGQECRSEPETRWIARLTAFCVTILALTTVSALPGMAFDRNDSREERAAQAIFNALYMSSDAGEPSPAVIEAYDRAIFISRPDWGTGYQGFGNPTDEDGWGMYVKYDVLFPTEAGFEQLNSDYTNIFQLDTTDSRTGAGIYRSGPYVHVVLYADDVVLRMQWGTARPDSDAASDPASQVRRIMKLWHFFYDEAVRLALLEPLDEPTLTVRVWDETDGAWRGLADAEVFSRLPAHLNEVERLTLELSADSQALEGDQPYEIDLMPGLGAEEVRLFDPATGEELTDTDDDGWLDVTVEAINGAHPPRQIVMEFRAMDVSGAPTAQRAVLYSRFQDNSGEASSGNLFERVTPVIVVNKLVLRAQNPANTLRQFPSEERTALQRRYDNPQGRAEDAEGLMDWINGVYDPLSDAKNNWTGQAGPTGGQVVKGFRDLVRLVPEDGTTRSQASAVSGEIGDGTVYMGWQRGNRTGIQFFTIEDRPGEPLTVGPLFEFHNAIFEVELAFLADVTAQFDPNDPNGYGQPMNPFEVQRKLYTDILGVERLYAGIYLVDRLDVFRVDGGDVREISAADHPAIKAALRQPTSDIVIQDIRNETAADSELLVTYFGDVDKVRVPTMGVPLNNLPIEPGVYEVQFDLRLWERADRDQKYRVTAAARFWAWDVDGFVENTRIQTDFTGRQDPGSSRRPQRRP